jgi:dolichol-phosphate mannosyltransferase
MTSSGLEEKVRRLQGPILVLGASGFLGANLLRTLLAYRDDVHGTVFHTPAWRLDGVPERNTFVVDLLVDSNRNDLLERLRPRTVFNCVGYGGYSFEAESDLIYETNFNLTAKLLRRLETLDIACYVHSGSSSEYGDAASGPRELDLPQPNSEYAVSKVACANLLRLCGKKASLPCANLRLFSVYGPYEDASRLVPALIRNGMEGRFPPFVDGAVSRDFVYVDDVVDALVRASDRGSGLVINIGTGVETSVNDLYGAMARATGFKEPPSYAPARAGELARSALAVAALFLLAGAAAVIGKPGVVFAIVMSVVEAVWIPATAIALARWQPSEPDHLP